jgi:hypothetical protein
VRSESDVVETGDCSVDSPCVSFETTLELIEKFMAIEILGESFSNGNFSIPINSFVHIETATEELELNGKSTLMYLNEEEEEEPLPFITIEMSCSLIIRNIIIIFDDRNKGSFISLIGLFSIFYFLFYLISYFIFILFLFYFYFNFLF